MRPGPLPVPLRFDGGGSNPCPNRIGNVPDPSAGPGPDRSLLVLLLFFLLPIPVLWSAEPPAGDSDRKYFQEFTKQMRDINKVKEKHLVRIFPMIGLSPIQAEAVYSFTRQQGGIASLEDLLSVPVISPDDLTVLKRYFFVPETGTAAVPSTNSELESSLDESLESVQNDESETEDDPVRTDLEILADDRLDLNSASPADLARLPWLTPFNIYNIIRQREQKPFRKAEDLLTVPGLDEETVRNLKPFVTATPSGRDAVMSQVEAVRKKTVKPVSGEASFRSVSALPPVEDHFKRVLSPSTAGFKTSVKLDLFGMVRTGAVVEQDKGERSFYDLFKYFILTENIGVLKKAVWGNFRVTAGQGLTVSDHGPSKNADPASLRQGRTTALKEDLSSTENEWFFGPAVHLQAGPVEGFLFYSRMHHDAMVENRSIVSYSPSSDGLHDTRTALDKKDRIIRRSFGGRAVYSLPIPAPVNHLKLGLTAFHTILSLPVVTPYEAYDVFDFQGKTLSLFGCDWDLVLPSLAFFGELSANLRPDPIGYTEDSTNRLKHSFGLYTGLLFQSRIGRTGLAFRHYQNGWGGMETAALSEYAGGGRGETGLYCGHELKITKATKINAGLDVFTSTWRRFDETIAPFGSELLVGAEHRFADRTMLSARIKTERKLVKWSSGSSSVMTVADYDRRIRGEIRIPILSGLVVRFRTEYSRTAVPELEKEYDSLLAFADASWTPFSATKIQCRLTGFDAVYEAGIWEYENDIPSYMSSPSLLGRGGRFYALFSRTIAAGNISFHLKTAVTRYFHKTQDAEIRQEDSALSASEAADKTAGEVRYEVRCQVLSKF